ncbi:hypothetical protein [Rhodoblastus sp.]|uniref:hypothetical protein n=1 Tax=Rhodoblastus sp. TaxID=1962975 RepID=UPI0035B1A1C4
MTTILPDRRIFVRMILFEFSQSRKIARIGKSFNLRRFARHTCGATASVTAP